MMGCLHVEQHGAVLLMALNRPQSANALDGELLDELTLALRQARDDTCRAIVIGGRGRHFCAGSDLKAALKDPAAMDLRSRFHPMMLMLADLNKPIVAAVNGAAAGGGLGLALAADMRVMGQSARFVPSWSPLGLVPDLGASWRLARMLGPARAFAWLAMAEPMTSDAALANGLANVVVDDGLEITAALKVAADLSAYPGPALGLMRELLNRAPEQGLAEQLEDEARAQAVAMAHPDQIEALRARVAALGG